MTIQHTTIDCTPGYPTHNCWLYTWLSNTEQFTVHLVIHRRTVACTPSKSTRNKMTNIPTNGPIDLFSFDTWITRFQSALDKNHTFPISVGEESHFPNFIFWSRWSKQQQVQWARAWDLWPSQRLCVNNMLGKAHATWRPQTLFLQCSRSRFITDQLNCPDEWMDSEPPCSTVSCVLLYSSNIGPFNFIPSSCLPFFFFFCLATDSLAHAW